ncbi:Hypothetical protein I595_980 [Croceitalea dokdonensis DOKDO 023]|uniref:Uncharacterized protein n=1 Tax=Croceitalea dokdonensis DOKDO 023 TaxID=1300341 RepID=A0A0P7AGJ3_9FLAO|nr:Hypothetical protein I595_980 [Croceitalea dokdonensis DOKDO 023]
MFLNYYLIAIFPNLNLDVSNFKSIIYTLFPCIHLGQFE